MKKNIFILFTLLFIRLNTYSQCTGCTQVISSNQNNLTVSSGTVCVNAGVTITGNITISNNATLCNQGILNANSIQVGTAQSGNLNNYGTINTPTILWGTNATGTINNYGNITVTDLNLGYHNGYNVNYTSHPSSNLVVNCSAYLLSGSFIFNGPATFNCPIYFSGSNSNVTWTVNSTFNCTNQINSSAGTSNTITIQPNATLTTHSWTITDDAVIQNNGTTQLAGDLNIQAGPGEVINFNQNNILKVKGSSASTGLSVSGTLGSVQFLNNGPTSVQNRISFQGGNLVMNGYNMFCNSLYLTSNASVSTTLNCGGRINVTGTSILQNSSFGSGCDLCDIGGGWDANQGAFSGTYCTCNGIGTQGSYPNFSATTNCPVNCLTTYSTINQVACGSYTYNNQTYTNTGTYLHTLVNAAGCDSIVTLQLTINTGSTVQQNLVACDQYVSPSGLIYSQSGTYYDTLTTIHGCDSIIITTLNINDSYITIQNIQHCGIYISPSGAVYSQSGTYTENLQTIDGCDSTVTLYITISSLQATITQTNGVFQAGPANATSYQWLDCKSGQIIPGATLSSHTVPVNSEIACIVTLNNCIDTTDCLEYGLSALYENEDEIFVIYPNPVDDILFIESNIVQEYKIINRLGQFVLSGWTSQGIQSIDISNLATDIYFIKFETFTYKLIKM
jgi:hypothetical protein